MRPSHDYEMTYVKTEYMLNHKKANFCVQRLNCDRT